MSPLTPLAAQLHQAYGGHDEVHRMHTSHAWSGAGDKELATSGTAVLSPRAYAALTLAGSATDGVGILQRLEVEIRKRAQEEWKRTGNPDAHHNWTAAERQLVISTKHAASGLLPNRRRSLTRVSSWDDPDHEVQWLRQQVASMYSKSSSTANPSCAPTLEGAAKELESLQRSSSGLEAKEAAEAAIARLKRELEEQRAAVRERDEQLEALRRALGTVETQSTANAETVKVLRKELAATDQLLVQRNSHCRKVELAMGELQGKMAQQEQQLRMQGRLSQQASQTGGSVAGAADAAVEPKDAEVQASADELKEA